MIGDEQRIVFVVVRVLHRGRCIAGAVQNLIGREAGGRGDECRDTPGSSGVADLEQVAVVLVIGARPPGRGHEGGIGTPLVVHWPAGVKAKGEFRPQVGHLVDLMATCVDVAGAKYPTEFHGKPILPMEGKSLLPAFANEPSSRDAVFWEHEGNAAVRVGDWKLHFPHEYNSIEGRTGAKNGKPNGYTKKQIGVALYNLREDIGESQNRAETEEAVMREDPGEQ